MLYALKRAMHKVQRLLFHLYRKISRVGILWVNHTTLFIKVFFENTDLT